MEVLRLMAVTVTVTVVRRCDLKEKYIVVVAAAAAVVVAVVGAIGSLPLLWCCSVVFQPTR